MKKVFIDGSAGTTGLRIAQRLAEREDIRLLTLPDALRKEPAARQAVMNEADIVFLCLPDDAAREAVGLLQNPETVLIDTSTAHRTAEGWAYGFPELSQTHWESILSSRRISVPGCHASGFIALVRPLVEQGLLPREARLSCHSLTGYSGGGKQMIGDYARADRSPLLDAPRLYALGCSHKHLKEMRRWTGLDAAPLFTPIVADYYSGMLVTVPLFAQGALQPQRVRELYRDLYHSSIVACRDEADAGGFFSASGLSGLDCMEISVFGNEEQLLLCARYDNLGKGASGAAIECMNLKLGTDITTGLVTLANTASPA